MDGNTAKKTADAVVKTLSNYRNKESFTQMWSQADVIAPKSEMPRCLEPDHHADFRALLSGETPLCSDRQLTTDGKRPLSYHSLLHKY